MAERDPSGTIGRNLEPFLLLELLRTPSYGYDLIRRLGDYGFRRAVSEPSVVYKVLRALEDGGFILSEWSTQESGPARRYYHITEAGQDLLTRRMSQVQRFAERLERLAAEYRQLTDQAGTPSPHPLPLSGGEGRQEVPSPLEGRGRSAPADPVKGDLPATRASPAGV